MRVTLRWSLFATLLAMPLSCAQCTDVPRARPPLRVVEEPPPPLPSRPVGWPYWSPVAVSVSRGTAGVGLPLDAITSERLLPSRARWDALEAGLREKLVSVGVATVRGSPRSFSVGDFYLREACDGNPSVLTVDAFMAVTFLAVEAALGDAELRVSSPAMHTILGRLDKRLAAAEPGAHPDLTAGLHVAEGIVAVASSLLDASYVAPDEVKGIVSAELALVRGHAGLTTSPLLRGPLDYAAFGRRGAVSDVTLGQYLAAQWLSQASLVFGAGESTSHVDMSSARARTRGALLLARLFTASGEDVTPRRALLELERLGELAYGEASGASPIVLAQFALDHGLDANDSRAIGDPASLDRIRRSAASTLESMELVPLRRAPDLLAFGQQTALGDGGVGPEASNVTSWLTSAAWTSASVDRHASFARSALDAVAVWLGPSGADGTVLASATPEWEKRKATAAIAAWSILRHGSVPFARVLARRAPTPSPATDCAHAAPLLIEPHPEALAALLGYVRQVSSGLSALNALGDGSPSRETLLDVDATLESALTIALDQERGSAFFVAREEELAALPSRLARIEARIAPAAGPFVATVLTDPPKSRALVVGTAGLDTVYLVMRDPRTGHPVLAQGAELVPSERWTASSVEMTDQEWATSLSSAK